MKEINLKIEHGMTNDKQGGIHPSINFDYYFQQQNVILYYTRMVMVK